MTTKHRIVFGFMVMVVLLGGVAYLGYTALQDSSGGFDEYRRLARFNATTSDLSANVYAAAYNVGQFLESRKASDMDQARAALAAVAGMAEESLKYTRPESPRAAVLKDIVKKLHDLRLFFDTLQKTVLESVEQYTGVVQPSMTEFQANLMDMTRQALAENNANALARISETWNPLALFRSGISRYSQSRSEKDEELVKKYLAELNSALKALEIELRAEESHKLFAVLSKSSQAVSDAFAAMAASARQAGQVLDDINALESKIREVANSLSASVAEEQNTLGPATVQANEAAQQRMLLASVGGMVLGIVFALFIVVGIIRVLKQLGGFAKAIAGGDFFYQLSIREKGEIGSMVEAMKQIPSVLDRVIHDANTLANGILSGRFRDRLEAGSFSGSFGDLAKAVNIVGDAYTIVLDALPVPVMSCDKEKNILFLNRNAQSTVDGNHPGTQCSRHLDSDACGKNGCFGHCAMAQKAPYTGETIIRPKGKRMDVIVTALPLYDMRNEVVGFMEILTDLTEIKAKQEVMMRVAGEASEISARVAAASEELAAQVEEVSRGADVQRSRMESTASAMTEMNSTVLEVARNAGAASEQSENTRQKAEEGSGLVNNVVSAINKVNTVATTLHGNMQELGQQAESIGGVMNVISDIADQTNLLALNAAIEAARAGEAGRGFAVVADEVRKLAEKTMAATKEVGDNISAIQHSAKTNIDEVANAVTSVTEATQLANSSGAALKEIVDLASANSAVVASIATAAEEQSATSEEINHAIEEINRIVAETSDGMVQSSAAVQDLSQTAQELRRIMERLK